MLRGISWARYDSTSLTLITTERSIFFWLRQSLRLVRPALLIWLGDDKGNFVPLDHPAGPALVFGAADLKGDGKLDLVGLSVDGAPVQAMNQGSKKYHWQIVRPHAVQARWRPTHQPIRIGGEIEIRSGLLVQKQPITGSATSFRIGRTDRGGHRASSPGRMERCAPNLA